jgi:hypothetical protein
MVVPQSQQLGLPEGSRVYMLRGTRLVPLIPADQLSYQVQGVPRELTHREMSDGNWKFSHEAENPATILGIQAPGSIAPPQSPTPNSIAPRQSPAPSKPRFLAPDHHVRNESCYVGFNALQASTAHLSQYSAEQLSGHTPLTVTATPDQSTSLVDTFSTIYPEDAQRFKYRKPTPSGLQPDQSKKVYCTYWMKTGDCSYLSYHCKYKHEMPTSRAKLRELGFRDFPQWWKDKCAIGARAPTWMNQRLARRDANGDSPDDVQHPRPFPDPPIFSIKQRDDEQGEGHGHSALCQAENLQSISTPAPISEATSRRGSQISNLLLDFNEGHAPPSRPRLFRRSSSIASSSCATISSASSSKSSSSSPVNERFVTTLKDTAARPGTTNKAVEEQQVVTTDARPGPHASRDIEVKADAAPIKQASTSNLAPPERSSVRWSKKAHKNYGLADSKYATSSKEKPMVIETQIKDRSRKVPQPEEKPTPTGPRADLAQGRRVFPRK